MEQAEKYLEAGRKTAEWFIRHERIDYDPFVAISDLYLVRKTVPVGYLALQQTICRFDPELWEEIDAAARRRADEFGDGFKFDDFAGGFVEGVDAVWQKIRSEVLKQR